MFKPDTSEQLHIKTVAAEKEMQFVMDEYDKNLLSLLDNDSRHQMFPSRANYFFCCIRSFHPLTMHLKVKNFAQY